MGACERRMRGVLAAGQGVGGGGAGERERGGERGTQVCARRLGVPSYFIYYFFERESRNLSQREGTGRQDHETSKRGRKEREEEKR
eukprot:scaffold233074_cov30-Tisochrysis_lutea.AAC.2